MVSKTELTVVRWKGGEQMRIYHCEDSLEGIFTAIYNTYQDHSHIRDTMVTTIDENLLFSESVEVIPDQEKTVKVIRTLKRKFGEEDYESLCLALSSPAPEKAQAVYRTIARGLAEKTTAGHLLDALADPYVNQTFSLARGAGREYDHLRGFARFEELESEILYAKICPKNNILTFLMVHFADRFPMEDFLLFDAGRYLFGVHPAGSPWYILQGRDVWEKVRPETERLTGAELKYRELFRSFCHTIAIKERENRELQRNMLPLRFQEYMVEFR